MIHGNVVPNVKHITYRSLPLSSFSMRRSYSPWKAGASHKHFFLWSLYACSVNENHPANLYILQLTRSVKHFGEQSLLLGVEEGESSRRRGRLPNNRQQHLFRNCWLSVEQERKRRSMSGGFGCQAMLLKLENIIFPQLHRHKCIKGCKR